MICSLTPNSRKNFAEHFCRSSRKKNLEDFHRSFFRSLAKSQQEMNMIVSLGILIYVPPEISLEVPKKLRSTVCSYSDLQ